MRHSQRDHFDFRARHVLVLSLLSSCLALGAALSQFLDLESAADLSLFYFALILIVAFAMMRRSPAIGVFLSVLSVYSIAPLYIASNFRGIVERSAFEMNAYVEVEPGLVHFVASSLLFGSVMAFAIAIHSQKVAVPASMEDEPALAPRGRLVLPGLVSLAVGLYFFVSLLGRWGDASYVNNDVIKTGRFDSFLLTWSPILLGSLIATWYKAGLPKGRLERVLVNSSIAVLGIGTILLLTRIGARAQLLFLAAFLIPTAWSWARREGSNRFVRGVVFAFLLLTVLASFIALRVVRSPLYNGQSLIAQVIEQVTSLESIMDQDYAYPGLTLVDSQNVQRLSLRELLKSEIGAAIPFAPVESTSLQYARALGAERAARNEGFGSNPLLVGLTVGGLSGVAVNAVLFAFAATAMASVWRRLSCASNPSLPIGFVLSSSIFISRSEWMGVLFFYAVYYFPTNLIFGWNRLLQPWIRSRRVVASRSALAEPKGVI